MTDQIVIRTPNPHDISIEETETIAQAIRRAVKETYPRRALRVERTQSQSQVRRQGSSAKFVPQPSKDRDDFA